MSLSIPASEYTGLSTDEKPNTDIIANATYRETDTHVEYYWNGSTWKTWQQIYKEGRYIALGNNSGATGVLTIAFTNGTFTRIWDTTYGLHQKIETGAVINTTAGIRFTRYAERGLNPYIRIVFALDQINDCKFFAGFTQYDSLGMDTVNGTATDPYPEDSCAGLKMDANNSDLEAYHNGGVEGGVSDVVLGTADPNIIHTLEIRALDAVPKFQYKWDNAMAWIDVTDDIPFVLNEMTCQVWMENTAAVNKSFRLIDIYTRVDNRG